MLKRGIVAFHRADSELAATLWRQAAEILAIHGPRGLYASTQLNLALAFVDLGRFAEAATLVAENRPLYENPSKPRPPFVSPGSRAGWRAAWATRGAERLLARARQGYAAAGNAFNAALVALDLAELFLTEGRTAAVKPVARATAEVFADCDVAPEVFRAAKLFHEAAAAERVSPMNSSRASARHLTAGGLDARAGRLRGALTAESRRRTSAPYWLNSPGPPSAA